MPPTATSVPPTATPVTPTATVPDVVGLAQAGAETAIIASNLVVGAVTTDFSDTVPAGNVISQNPTGGMVVDEGAAVNFVASLGPPTPVLAIANVEGTAGTTVTMDVFFSNPLGTGFSILVWRMTIQNPDIAEFVDVQFPDWINPIFAGFLWDFTFVDGSPAPLIGLVVWDLDIDFDFDFDAGFEFEGRLAGTLTNEVLATVSLNLLIPGETTIELNLIQLDDDDFEGHVSEDLKPITEFPISVTINVLP